MPTKKKVAIVIDWLTVMGGAEQMIIELHKLFPDAPVYTSVYDKKNMKAFDGIDVRTTYLEKVLPKFIRYKHTLWPVFRAHAFRKLDLSEFDIIISVSTAEAKAIKKTRPDQIHIAYINTPTRYYYSHYKEFKKEYSFGLLTPIIRPLIPMFVSWMKRLDQASIKDIDVFIANSSVAQDRIKKYYRKTSSVIHPPVDINRFTPSPKQQKSGYVVWGRHVPYKRFDLAIKACNKLEKNLTIIGSGPDTERLKKIAGPTINFVGRLSDKELVKTVQSSYACLFPNEEDFGIVAAESLAAGTPVIAYKAGGALDIVQDGETGILFDEQTVDGLCNAIERFEKMSFLPATMHRKSKKFDKNLFASKIKKVVSDQISS